jgi:type IV pilus assembly PilX-like protein
MAMRRDSIQSDRIRPSEKGAALITSIFVLLLVTVLGMALTFIANTALVISSNDRQAAQAFYIAEAGIAHATKLVDATSPYNFGDILINGDGTPNNGDELSTKPTGYSDSPAFEGIPASGVAFAGGNYVVRVKDDASDTSTTDANNTIVITSTGTGPNGATATIEVFVIATPPRPAMFADGDINVSNSTFAFGSAGIIHANGTLGGSGDICAEQFVSHSSSSALNLNNINTGSSQATCTTPGVAGDTAKVSQSKLTPDIYDQAALQSKFRPQADFIMKTDGTIRNQSGTSLPLGSWTYASNKWTWASGNAIPEGTYYAEGSNIKISNGATTSPVSKITLIAEGSIEISGGPDMQPDLPGYSIVSANDLKITSKTGVSSNPGLVYAYGQIELTNQSTFYGWVQAANFRQSDGTTGLDVDDVGGSNLVSRASKGSLRISNKATVNTPPGGSSGGTQTTRWREVRN